MASGSSCHAIPYSLWMDSAEAARLWEANAEAWTKLVRAGYDIYRDQLNTPAFLEMLPPIRGLDGLDLGCGEGENTRQLARLGAKVCGIDIAPAFIGYARQSEEGEPLGIAYETADAQALPFPDSSFDFATAFMSLMDMPAPDRALSEAARVLRPGGFLQFSILHPCFAPPHRKVNREADGHIRSIEVARYFDRINGEIEMWCFSEAPAEARDHFPPFQVPRFHRTLSDWTDMAFEADLILEKILEPSATREQAMRFPALADTEVAPLFLIIRARRRPA